MSFTLQLSYVDQSLLLNAVRKLVGANYFRDCILETRMRMDDDDPSSPISCSFHVLCLEDLIELVAACKEAGPQEMNLFCRIENPSIVAMASLPLVLDGKGDKVGEIRQKNRNSKMVMQIIQEAEHVMRGKLEQLRNFCMESE